MRSRILPAALLLASCASVQDRPLPLPSMPALRMLLRPEGPPAGETAAEAARKLGLKSERNRQIRHCRALAALPRGEAVSALRKELPCAEAPAMVAAALVALGEDARGPLEAALLGSDRRESLFAARAVLDLLPEDPALKPLAERTLEALEAEIASALERACAFLETDPPFEMWPLENAWMEAPYRTGARALALLALEQAGTDPKAEGFVRMLKPLEPGTLDLPPVRNTYTESVLTLLDARLDPAGRRKRIARSAAWMLQARMGGDRAGQFRYDDSSPYTDNSVSHFALLSLSVASRKAGIAIPATVWREGEDFLRRTQRPDGGWPQGRKADGGSYGSMTAVGLASLLACKAERLGPAYATLDLQGDPAVRKAMGWLADHFEVERVPGIEGSGAALNDTDWQYDWFYALEKLELLTGSPWIGNRRWRDEAALRLLETQAPDGSWEGTFAEVPPIATAFAVLALSGPSGIAPYRPGPAPVRAHRSGVPSARTPKEWRDPLASLPQGERIFRRSCSACHALEERRVGPPLTEIAGLYRDSPEKLGDWARKPGRRRADYPAMPAARLPDAGSYLEVARFVLEAGGDPEGTKTRMRERSGSPR